MAALSFVHCIFLVFALSAYVQAAPLVKRRPPLASGSLDWANGCTLYYTIRPRDNCYQVAQNFNIPGGYQQFLKWNTGLNADCQTLKLGYNYCVAGPIGSTTTLSSAAQPQQPSTTRSTTSSSSSLFTTSQADGFTRSSIELVPTTAPAISSSSTSTWTPTSTSTTSTAVVVPQPTQDSTTNDISGQATYYYTGLGACGKWNKDSDYIVAASYQMFDNWPNAGWNPNLNPICGTKIRATSTQGGKSVVVSIVDRCPSCDYGHLDLSPAAFQALAPFSAGLIPISFQFVDPDVPLGPTDVW